MADWKLSFSTITKSWAIVAKISRIVAWINSTNWYEGHSFFTTYVVVRLSDVSSIFCKNHLKCIFSSKLSLHRTAWWPLRLSKMDALRINWSYSPKDQFMKFWWKLLSVWWWLKNSVFLSRPFWNFFRFFFCIVYGIPRMGQNFDDCPDFQKTQKIWIKFLFSVHVFECEIEYLVVKSCHICSTWV